MKVGVLGSGQLALMLAQASVGTDIEVVPIGHKILDKLVKLFLSSQLWSLGSGLFSFGTHKSLR